MSKKVYFYMVSIVFFIVAVVHLARIVYDWSLVLGGVAIPMWVSWIIVILLGYLCVRGWLFAKGK